jgi:hypothetical protein
MIRSSMNSLHRSKQARSGIIPTTVGCHLAPLATQVLDGLRGVLIHGASAPTSNCKMTHHPHKEENYSGCDINDGVYYIPLEADSLHGFLLALGHPLSQNVLLLPSHLSRYQTVANPAGPVPMYTYTLIDGLGRYLGIPQSPLAIINVSPLLVPID